MMLHSSFIDSKYSHDQHINDTELPLMIDLNMNPAACLDLKNGDKVTVDGTVLVVAEREDRIFLTAESSDQSAYTEAIDETDEATYSRYIQHLREFDAHSLGAAVMTREKMRALLEDRAYHIS